MADNDDQEEENFEENLEEEEEDEEDINIPIIQAAVEGDLIKVEQLIAEGADPGIADRNGWTSLMFASLKGRLNIVKRAGGSCCYGRERL